MGRSSHVERAAGVEQARPARALRVARALPGPLGLLAGVLGGLLAAGPLTGCADEELCTHQPALTWENFGRPYMDTWCNGCHAELLQGEDRNDAPGWVNLDSFRGVVFTAELLPSVSLGSEATMPPAGGPSEAEQARYEEWLRCEVLPTWHAYNEGQAALREAGR